MIPILYDTTEQAYTSNGLCRLRDCISCEVTEERNGIYECDFTYPVDGANYEQILCGRTIAVTHDDTDDVQLFDIESFSKPIDGVVSFHAVHVSYRLRGHVVSVASSVVGSLSETMDFFNFASQITNSPWTFEADFDSSGYMSAFDAIPRSIRQLLGGIEGSVLDTYGGEYLWDRFKVKLMKNRGSLRDFSIRYGVNMIDFTDDTDYAGTYNQCIPYWLGNDDRIAGDMVSLGQPTIYGRDVCVPLDLSDKFQNKPTKAQLEAKALSEMKRNKVNLPAQNIQVDFVRLQELGYEEFKGLLKCGLCDTINVVFPMYGMSGQFKIVRVVWDVLEGRYKEMELGDLRTSLAEALGISSGSNGEISIPKIDGGYIGQQGSVANNAYKDVDVTFTTEFTSPPYVSVNFHTGLSIGKFGAANIAVLLDSVTTTGFTFRWYNYSEADRNPQFVWLAVGR